MVDVPGYKIDKIILVPDGSAVVPTPTPTPTPDPGDPTTDPVPAPEPPVRGPGVIAFTATPDFFDAKGKFYRILAGTEPGYEQFAVVSDDQIVVSLDPTKEYKNPISFALPDYATATNLEAQLRLNGAHVDLWNGPTRSVTGIEARGNITHNPDFRKLSVIGPGKITTMQDRGDLRGVHFLSGVVGEVQGVDIVCPGMGIAGQPSLLIINKVKITLGGAGRSTGKSHCVYVQNVEHLTVTDFHGESVHGHVFKYSLKDDTSDAVFVNFTGIEGAGNTGAVVHDITGVGETWFEGALFHQTSEGGNKVIELIGGGGYIGGGTHHYKNVTMKSDIPVATADVVKVPRLDLGPAMQFINEGGNTFINHTGEVVELFSIIDEG